ncbi:dihydroneopterin aldolase [Oxalobacter vibrioformis]|uniref:dihydroneopterin aldolase n=1 Tax=Oxalobacter vibrioformis TaxID=933080 RepID=A0A9E9M1Q0_9BURK|nr:dihydroneopterin aldolase [Oxalobacter vibrioformis]WAW11178.1 dihydroneopterin aldolase [Oxalobacter vibrioformis]
MHTLLHPRLTDCRRVFLRNCEITTRIGIHDYEKQGPQRLIINVDLFIPLAISTPLEDELAEVIDYSFIREAIDSLVSRGHINLQETFCDELAHLLLAHPDIRAVRVTTEKPDVYDNADSIGVEVFHIKREKT